MEWTTALVPSVLSGASALFMSTVYAKRVSVCWATIMSSAWLLLQLASLFGLSRCFDEYASFLCAMLSIAWVGVFACFLMKLYELACAFSLGALFVYALGIRHAVLSSQLLATLLIVLASLWPLVTLLFAFSLSLHSRNRVFSTGAQFIARSCLACVRQTRDDGDV